MKKQSGDGNGAKPAQPKPPKPADRIPDEMGDAIKKHHQSPGTKEGKG